MPFFRPGITALSIVFDVLANMPLIKDIRDGKKRFFKRVKHSKFAINNDYGGVLNIVFY
jgi:hypothetical protein